MFEAITVQLTAQAVTVKTGTLVDATVIAWGKLNMTVTGAQTLLVILEHSATAVLAAWTSNQPDGSLQGVYAQRLQYAPAP